MTDKISPRVAILIASVIVGVLAVAVAVAVVFLLIGRSGPAPEAVIQRTVIGEPVSIELPAEEAATVTHDSGARIEIPAGAITESTTASVAEVEPPISFVPVGRVFDFSVGDVELARPVTIHIPFELGPDDDISQVQALHWNETQAIWEPVAGTVDSSTMTVAVTTSELSWFTAIANKLQTAWDSFFGQERSQTVQHTCWTEPRRIPESNQFEEVEEDQQRDIFSEVTNISEDNNIFVRFEVSNPHFDLYEKQQTGSVAIPIGASRTFKAPVYTDYADGGYIATCTVVSEGLPGLHLDLASHTIPFAVVGPGKLDLPPDDRKATFSECWPGTIDQEEPSAMYDTIGSVHMHGGAALRRLRDQTEQYLAWYYIYKDGDDVARAPKEWELLKIGAGSSGGTIAEAYQQLLPGVVDAKEILGVSLNHGMGIGLQDSGKYTYRCTLYSQDAITDDPITALSKIPQCNTRERLTDSLCISKTVYEAIPDWHFQSMRTGYFCIRDCTPGIDTGFKVDGKDIRADTEQSIEIGKTVTLSFELGGLDKKAEHGGITVSFPNLTWPSSEQASYKTRLADVSTANSVGEASGVTYYDRGDIVWRYRGDTIEADYLMVESYEADLQADSERTLELTFTPYVAGDYQVLYRSWLCGEEYLGCLREPTASSDPAKPDTYDQQEWETYSFNIKVLEPKPDPPPPPAPPVVVPPAPDVSDREALVALYHSTDGSGWKNNVQDNQSWLVDNTASAIGDWYGVTTFDDKPNRVKYLIVEENCLEGRLPEAIGGLSELQLLILQWNSRLNCDGLTGQIPPSLSNLTNLWELDLSENRLSGTIPDALGNLASLEVLDLSDNRFSGEIPSSLGSLENLYAIDLRNNRLEGQIPDKLAELPNLEELYLSGGKNEFMGCIPAALFDIDDHDLDELGLEPCGDDEDVVAPVTVRFSKAEYTVNEDAGEVELTVTLSEPLDHLVNVHLRIIQGTAGWRQDYGNLSNEGNLFFPPNSTSQTSTISILDDQILEATQENFTVQILEAFSAVSPVATSIISPASVTIVDNDEVTVGFQQAEFRIRENTSDFTLCAYVATPSQAPQHEVPFTVHVSYMDPHGAVSSGSSALQFGGRGPSGTGCGRFEISQGNVVNEPSEVVFSLNSVTSDYPGVASRVLIGSSTATLVVIGAEEAQATTTSGQFASVSAGLHHTCAVRTDGSITCWGGDGWGEATPPNGQFASVSAGLFHTCGVRTDGSIVCWGSNEDLHGNVIGQATPPSGRFVSVSAGDLHACGVRTDGSLACWGYDEHGQTTPPNGQFNSVSAGGYYTCGVKIDGSIACWGGVDQAMLPEGEFASVSTGLVHTCGVRTDGSVACWGSNEDWHGNVVGQATPPSGRFVSVSSGKIHTCGVRTNGSLACWGSNEDWIGNVIGQATPPSGQFVSVGAGDYHTCGVRADGSVACWGYDEHGQTTPPERGVTSVSAGSRHNCGVRSDGSVFCWGSNNNEIGNVVGQATPPSGQFVSVSSGWVHTCGVMFSGSVACWGSNNDWNGNTIGQATPPNGQFISVSAGGYHSCGVRTDSSVACWGDDSWGQATPPNGQFVAVSAGRYHTCGAKNDGSVDCWGYDEFGQATPPEREIASISAGGFHTCGVSPDGTVTCWGSNEDWHRNLVGQSMSPGGQFVSVSAGDRHTCGVKIDGSVVCWGFDHREGQAPAPEGEFTSVSAGSSHTCGVRSDGSLICWGTKTRG